MYMCISWTFQKWIRYAAKTSKSPPIKPAPHYLISFYRQKNTSKPKVPGSAGLLLTWRRESESDISQARPEKLKISASNRWCSGDFRESIRDIPPTAKTSFIGKNIHFNIVFHATLSRIFLKLCNLCLPEFSPNWPLPDPEPFRKLTRSHRRSFPNRGFVTYHRQPASVYTTKKWQKQDLSINVHPFSVHLLLFKDFSATLATPDMPWIPKDLLLPRISRFVSLPTAVHLQRSQPFRKGQTGRKVRHRWILWKLRNFKL